MMRTLVVLFLFLSMVFVLPSNSDCAFFGSLKDEIQAELDTNPFLKKQGIKLKVAEVENGYITIAIEEGNQELRKKIYSGQEIDSSLWATSTPEEKKSIKALKKTVAVITEMKGVKAIFLEAVVGTAEDKKQEESLREIAKSLHYQELSRWHDVCEMISFDKIKVERKSDNIFRYYYKSKWKITKKTTGQQKEGYAVYSIWSFDGFRWEKYKSVRQFDPLLDVAALMSGGKKYIPAGETFFINNYVDVSDKLIQKYRAL